MTLWVGGIVAARNHEPYIVISKDENTIAQLSMAEARQFANDILLQASRSEADAMIHKFFSKAEFPQGAHDAIMLEFRDFRAELDKNLERL